MKFAARAGGAMTVSRRIRKSQTVFVVLSSIGRHVDVEPHSGSMIGHESTPGHMSGGVAPSQLGTGNVPGDALQAPPVAPPPSVTGRNVNVLHAMLLIARPAAAAATQGTATLSHFEIFIEASRSQPRNV